MPSNSSVAGFLAPTGSPTLLDGDALTDFFQAMVVGITGMVATSVRPRWQPEPPNYPDGDWAAIGIMAIASDTYAAEIPKPTGNGSVEMRRHEVLRILVSFYGVNANKNAGLLKDGLQIDQNREVLSLNNMGLVDSEDVIPVPSIIKEKWLYRVDLPFSIKRQVVRNYAVESLLSSQFTTTSDNPPLTETVNVTQ